MLYSVCYILKLDYLEFVDTEYKYLRKTGVCDDSKLSGFVQPEGWSCRWDEDDLEEQVWERQSKFSFEQVVFEINMQMDLSGRHLDLRAWSSGDRNSVFIYALSELFKRKLVICVLWGKPRHYLCVRVALAVDPPHSLLIIAEAAIKSIGWLITHSMALFTLPGRANRCLSKAPSFMNDGSWAFTPLPPLMDIADANTMLMKVKEESEKVGLKLSILKTKIMESSPITSWQIDGETVETVDDFIFGGSKITADGDCSHEIKRHLLLGRKAMTNLDSILKSRDITLPTKVCLVKAMVFPVVLYGC